MKPTATILICLILMQGFGNDMLATGWYYVVDNDHRRQLEKDTIFYFIDTTPIVAPKHFTTLEVTEDNWHNAMLVIKFDKEGTKAWSNATAKYIGRRLALIIDNKLMIAPKVNSQITGGVSALNAKWYSKQDLEKFKTIIEKEK
jgi:preprotein translocase subunit SecD